MFQIPIFDSNLAGFFKVLFLSFWVFMLTSCLDTHQDKLRDFSYQIKDYIHQSKTEKKFAYADSLKYERNYPLCTKAFRYILAHKPLNKEDSIYALNQIVFAYLKMDKDSLAEYFVQQLERIKGDFSEVQKADFLFNQGLLHLHLIKPTEAQSFLATAFKLYIAHYPNNHLRIALVKTALAQYYYDFGKHAHNFENAANEAFLCFYPRAETKPSVLHPYAAEAHFLMAHRYRGIYRDYRPGLNHCEVAEGLINSVPWKDTKLMARCLGVKGLFLKKESKFQAADSVMNKGLRLLLATLPHSVIVQEMYRFLMVNAAGRTDMPGAESRALFNSYFVALDAHLRKFNQPEVYAQKDELKAYCFFQRAHLSLDSCWLMCLVSRKKISPLMPSFRYYDEEMLNYLAEVYVAKENYAVALDYQLESFKTRIPKVEDSRISTWKEARALKFTTVQANFFFFHYKAGSIFLKKYKKEKKEKYLKEAVEQFVLADSLMSLRLTMGDEGVLTYYQEMEDAYFDPLEAIYEMKKINQDSNQSLVLNNLAFQFIERQKSFLLYREDILQGNEQTKIYLKQIKKEAKEINLLQEDITEKGALNSTLASFRYQQLLVKLLKEASWKFNQKIELVEKIQKSLQEQEFIIQYKAIRKDYFLVLALGKHQMVFEKIDSLPEIQQLIHQFSDTILAKNGNSNAFLLPAHKLYKKLIGPLKKILPKHNAELIIIPDHFLSNFPFEALVSQYPDSSTVQNPNFLLNKHVVVYAPSWKVWNYNRKEPLPQENHRAAFFTYSVDSPIGLYLWETEWNAMKAFFGSKADLYNKGRCSKNKFLQIAYRYKVLHFSLHGQSDPQRLRGNELFFKLVDTIKTDTLTGIELSDLDLRGKLVVLSACQTNDGKITPEGTYSLSRAFLQAGCASTISTLWSVDEQATAKILERFYVHLAKHSPWIALSKAKQDYVRNHKSRPYLWAGLVATI
jgi:CHAT domain-containing protein